MNSQLIVYLILLALFVFTLRRENLKLADKERVGQLKTEQAHRFGWLVTLHGLLFMLILGAAIAEHLILRRRSWTVSMVGAIAFAFGTMIHNFVAIRTLGKSITPYIEPPKDGRLVIEGIYKYIRHPVYLGQIMIVVSAPLVLNSYYTLLLSILLIGVLLARVSLEEKQMRSLFPGYPDYMSATKRFVPFLF